jgi:lantibiotic modifying enzyme
MVKEIKTILHSIYQQSDPNSTHDHSLLAGKAGILLFKISYCNYFNCKFDSDLNDQIQELALTSFNTRDMTFGSGKAGIKWFFTFLYHSRIISKSDWQFVCSNNKDLMDSAIKMINKEKYEFLYGAIGISNYILLHDSKKNLNFFTKFNSQLDIFISNYLNRQGIIDLNRNLIPENYLDIGFAHGITSVLKYCITSIRLGISSKHIWNIVHKITNFLFELKNPFLEYSVYPQYLYLGIHDPKPSRLGWCTGDLMIAMQLYQSGLIQQKRQLINFGVDIFRHASKRLLQEDTNVRDACFCHGSAGIAHIFNKIWKSTNNAEFLLPRDFWLQKTVNYADLKDNAITYKWYNNETKIYDKEVGLLSGQTGIGLALLSYLNDDFLWDSCLMLEN